MAELPTIPDEVVRPASLDDWDYMQDKTWKEQKKHIFVLSVAGKPVYSLHGKEDKLATLFGVIQALVNVVKNSEDAITSIHAHGIKFVFMLTHQLILVAVSRTNMSVEHLQLQLNDVYNQILSSVTLLRMNKNFEAIGENFDVRRILGNSGRELLSHLLNTDNKTINNVMLALMDSMRVFPLCDRMRSNMTSIIRAKSKKHEQLVLALLIADKKLVTLMHRRKFPIHASDLRLICNLLESLELREECDRLLPICLPSFDKNVFFYALASQVAEDCQAWLLLVFRNAFPKDYNFATLWNIKSAIKNKLHSSHCFDAIKEEMEERGFNVRLDLTRFPELRHFMYKPKHIAQLVCSDILIPYGTPVGFERLQGIYCNLLHRMHNSARPLKEIYETNQQEVVLALEAKKYELYAVFEPMVDEKTVKNYVDSLKNFIEKDRNIFFINSYSKFGPDFKP